MPRLPRRGLRHCRQGKAHNPQKEGSSQISVVNDARQLDRLAARLKRPARTPGRTPSVPGPLPPRGLE